MASKFRISGGCERGTGTIPLMEGPVFRARPLQRLIFQPLPSVTSDSIQGSSRPGRPACVNGETQCSLTVRVSWQVRCHPGDITQLLEFRYFRES